MFKQLLEELSNIKKEVENKIRILEEVEEEVERLTQENQSLKDGIANHVCEKEIVEVFRTGYRLKEKVVRHSLVKVAN